MSRFGYDDISSGSYSGKWMEIYFAEDSTVVVTRPDGSSTITMNQGQRIVGNITGVQVNSGRILAYKKDATDKVDLLDAATVTLLSQATTDGYTAASGDTLTALDNYIKGLKADGIWSKLDLLYVFATNGDSDFATYNILDPTTFQATKVNSPTFTSLEGFTGDGSTSYLNTNFTPSTDAVNMTLNSSSWGVYSRTSAVQGASGAFISASPNRVTLVLPRNVADNALYGNNGSVQVGTANADGSGFYQSNRADSSNISLYKNGSSIDSAASSSTALVDDTMLALARRRESSGVDTYSSGQISIVFAGADLSAEASDFFTRTEAYMDALGKGVVS